MVLQKIFTTITAVSKKLAFVLFFLLFVLIFLLGLRYQKFAPMSKQNSTISGTNQVISKAKVTEPVITKEVFPTMPSLINQYVDKAQNSFYLYRNPDTNMSFQFSQSFYISGSECSIVLVKNNNGSPMNPYIHIATIKKSSEQLCVWPIYSGQENEYEMLSQISIGQSINKNENKNLASFFTYKRMEDQIHQENTWKLFVSNKVWEATETTKDYVYLFETPSKNIWVMGLIDSQNKEIDSILFDDLKHIISSFQI